MANPAIILDIPNMEGEGIEYDNGLHDRILVGSKSTGTIRGTYI